MSVRRWTEDSKKVTRTKKITKRLQEDGSKMVRGV